MPLPSQEIPFERTSAKQKVYETVKDWIIERQFKPGEKVSDVEIAEYFNISRTPVREALQLLEAQKAGEILSWEGDDCYGDRDGKYRKMVFAYGHTAAACDKISSGKNYSMHIDRLKLLSEIFIESVKEQK